MKRSILIIPGAVLLTLTVTSIVFAQEVSTIRVTSTSVVVEQPRGDATRSTLGSK